MTDRSSPSEQPDDASAGEAGADFARTADGDTASEPGTHWESTERRNRDETTDGGPSDPTPHDRVPEESAGDAPEVEAPDDDAPEDDDPSLAGIFGGDPSDAPERTPITPGDPSLENALFVVFGVILSVFVLYTAWSVFTA